MSSVNWKGMCVTSLTRPVLQRLRDVFDKHRHDGSPVLLGLSAAADLLAGRLRPIRDYGLGSARSQSHHTGDGAMEIVGNDWYMHLDKVFIENLGKFRKYNGWSV